MWVTCVFSLSTRNSVIDRLKQNADREFAGVSWNSVADQVCFFRLFFKMEAKLITRDYIYVFEADA